MKFARWQRWLLVIIALGSVLWVFDRYRTWREDAHDGIIAEAAARHGVDPALIKAVIWRESRFDPKVRGSKGEVGLMQIMEPTARDWAKATRRTVFLHAELFEPRKNVDCGTWYLRKLLARYPQTDNPLPYTLADYNAGRGNVLKWMQAPAATNSAAFIAKIGFPSTQDYVVSTLARYEKYRAQWKER